MTVHRYNLFDWLIKVLHRITVLLPVTHLQTCIYSPISLVTEINNIYMSIIFFIFYAYNYDTVFGKHEIIFTNIINYSVWLFLHVDQLLQILQHVREKIQSVPFNTLQVTVWSRKANASGSFIWFLFLSTVFIWNNID